MYGDSWRTGGSFDELDSNGYITLEVCDFDSNKVSRICRGSVLARKHHPLDQMLALLRGELPEGSYDASDGVCGRH